jgi:hypothetical protein
METAADFDSRLDFLSTRLLARPLSLTEKQMAKRSLDEFRRHYQLNPEDATKLLTTGERKANPALPPADYAAMTMLVNQFLNLDEALNK